MSPCVFVLDAKTNIRDYHGKMAAHYWTGSAHVFERPDLSGEDHGLGCFLPPALSHMTSQVCVPQVGRCLGGSWGSVTSFLPCVYLGPAAMDISAWTLGVALQMGTPGTFRCDHHERGVQRPRPPLEGALQ